MTETYARPFATPGASAPSEHQALVAALGFGLLLTVLALAWDGLAARLEPSNSSVSSRSDAAERLKPEGPRPLVVETASPTWILEETSP